MTNAEWTEAVAREHYDRILNIAYRRALRYHISDPADWAADRTQDVFVVLCGRAEEEKLRQHPNLAAWLNEVLKNVIRNDRKKRSAREIPMAHVETLPRAPIEKLVLEDPFPPGLSQEERDLLYRCHCLKLPRREIAASLGVTLGACQMRLQRAEEHFRALRQKNDAPSTRFDGFRQESAHILQEGGAKHV